MYSVKKGNHFQLAAMSYFIFGNLAFGIVVSIFGGEVSIVTSILVSQVLLIGAAVLLYVVITKSNLNNLFIKPIAWLDALICVGIAWTIMPLLSLINVLSQFFVRNQIQDALADMLDLPFIITLLLTGLSPAILEELLSRSIILRNYQKKAVLTTCLVSGMFFGFIHLNINQFLYAFVMGAIMCYVVMITDSVVSAMIIHFTINTTGTATLYIANALMEILDSSGVTMEELLPTAAPTTGQLLISLVVMLFMALFFTPVAAILIRQLMDRHNKIFKGSFRRTTEDFMTRHIEVATHSFSEDIEAAKDGDPILTTHENEKVFTWPLIVTAVFFVIFSVMLEVSMRMAG